MPPLTGLQVFLGRHPLQSPKQKNQHAAHYHCTIFPPHTLGSSTWQKPHSDELCRETSVAWLHIHHEHRLTRTEPCMRKIHLHHAETGPKWLQWLNFFTCPIPFAQGSQTTTQDLRLRPTRNRAQLGKQNRLSQTFGALLIATDSFPPKWKNCHFQIITFRFLNSKKIHILKRKTCFKDACTSLPMRRHHNKLSFKGQQIYIAC